MIAAKILADSVSPAGRRITTFEATYPRFIHAETMTYRMWSRSTASSRAVPTKRFIDNVLNDPALPVWWGKSQAGMQAREQLEGVYLDLSKRGWLYAAGNALLAAKWMADQGLHKQIANRVLEPFLWHTAIITATEWDQFWRQRCHPDAQPEMQALARAMLRAYLESEPKLVDVGEWHMPFGDRMPEDASAEARLAIATGRCARISYMTHEGDFSPEQDMALHDRLRAAEPGHWSPFEHCATPARKNLAGQFFANFRGWKSYRAFVEPDYEPTVRAELETLALDHPQQLQELT